MSPDHPNRPDRPYHVLMAAGGTGGHIFPALSVADALKALDPSAAPVFVGAAQGLESKLVPAHGYPLELIRVQPLANARNPLVAAWRALGLSRSAAQSVRLLRRLKPALVIGAGGYASGPVTALAALACTPTAILEQNALPGLTNRLLARLVDQVFVSFASDRYPYPPHKVRALGNPIRPIAGATPDRPRADGKTHLLIFGGSQGAATLNAALPPALAALPPALAATLSVRHQTGRGREAEVQAAYQGFPGEVEVSPFIDAMPRAYAWSDIIICRAGATTVAELQAAAKPSVLVPFPFAAHNHQEENARAMVDAGASLMVLDAEARAQPQSLTAVLSHLLRFPSVQARMAAAAAALARPNAAHDVASACLALIHAHRRSA
jgi:UDP-N-acetylglucosamine--N-acetylmuramyl-(pentapeptide) pyrophosphoryl-undecaprenol N-acetylglucosamine transferase